MDFLRYLFILFRTLQLQLVLDLCPRMSVAGSSSNNTSNNTSNNNTRYSSNFYNCHMAQFILMYITRKGDGLPH